GLTLARGADLTAIAEHQRALAEIGDSEVVNVSSGVSVLTGSAGDVGAVVSPGHSNDGLIRGREGGSQDGDLQLEGVTGRSDPVMLHIEGPVGVLSQDGGRHRACEIAEDRAEVGDASNRPYVRRQGSSDVGAAYV